jgi:uncharacterized damage-inducible protein DinB
MPEPSRWFDRQFSLGLRLELAPNLIERVRGTPARLEERLRGVPAEVLVRRPGEAWSIQEHAGHLWDLEPLGHRRLEDFTAGKAELAAADLQNRRTQEARHNERPLADILIGFRAERERFVAFLEVADESFWSRTSLHPRLQKPMRPVDLLFFIAEHDDHHLAAITRLLRQSF